METLVVLNNRAKLAQILVENDLIRYEKEFELEIINFVRGLGYNTTKLIKFEPNLNNINRDICINIKTHKPRILGKKITIKEYQFVFKASEFYIIDTDINFKIVVKRKRFK